MIRLTVKWQKEQYEVTADTSAPPALFKAQLESLTGVPSDRQKIMVKGGMLKDDSDWAKTGLKDGAKVMMMGTAEKPIEAPQEEIKFLEDLPETEQDVQETKAYGAGLQNLGNTCYMNATLQCLYRVPELVSALGGLSDGQPAASGPSRISLASKALFRQMQSSNGAPINPLAFLMALRDAFPQFAEPGPGGAPMQQDAEECWSGLLNLLKQRLGADGEGGGVVKELFEIEMASELKCEETGEVWNGRSSQLLLKVNHLSEGIKMALVESRDMNSEALGRSAVWNGESRITRLPPWLTVQQVRFFYKVEVQQKAKILRKVGFPIVLDCYDMCAESVKAELDGPRAAWKRIEDARVQRKNLGADDAKRRKIEKGEAEGGAAMEVDGAPAESSADASKAQARAEAEAAVEEEASKAVAEFKGRPTGRYELRAVLTHKGRSADSGHYVAWCKQDDGKWVLYDDDQLTVKTEEEILALSGGGDWHMAYLLLYQAQKVPMEV